MKDDQSRQMEVCAQEEALILEYRELQRTRFMGSLQIHFPGDGGPCIVKIVPAARVLKLEETRKDLTLPKLKRL